MALSESAVLYSTVTTAGSAGAISLPGAKVGDIVFNSPSSGGSLGPGSNFETTISVDNQIQYTGNSSSAYQILLLRPEIVVASV